MNLIIAQAFAKFQAAMIANLGKPVNLVLLQAFAVLMADIVAALRSEKDES